MSSSRICDQSHGRLDGRCPQILGRCLQGCARPRHAHREGKCRVSFTFAGKISNALTPQDIVTLETQFAQDRMQAFVTQTQQLFSVIEEAIQKSERGAMDAGMGAMPSIPMGRWLQGSPRPCRGNREEECRVRVSFALVEKIAKAQNFQEIVTLQASFAQEQMRLSLHRCRSFKLMGKLSRSCHH